MYETQNFAIDTLAVESRSNRFGMARHVVVLGLATALLHPLSVDMLPAAGWWMSAVVLAVLVTACALLQWPLRGTVGMGLRGLVSAAVTAKPFPGIRIARWATSAVTMLVSVFAAAAIAATLAAWLGLPNAPGAVGGGSTTHLLLAVWGVLLLVGTFLVEPVVAILQDLQAAALGQNARMLQLAAVAQHTHSAVVITDTTRRIRWVNEGFHRITGYSLAEAIGRTPKELLQFEKTDPATVAAIRAALDAGVAFRGEILNRSREGREYWLDLDIQPLRDSSGAIVSFLAIQSDITARKLAEQELREAKARAEAALREIEALRQALDEHSIISVTDHTGRILEANTGFVRISGYGRDELLGRNHRILNSGRQGKEFWPRVWRTLANGRAWRGEVCNRRKDGTLYWVDSTIVPVRGNDGAVAKYVSIRFDITAQKSDAAALVAARAEAEAANAAKSQFLANMSHEIRTPMTAILGYATLLRESEQKPEVLQALDVIQRNGQRLLVILNDILDLSKIEAACMAVESCRFELGPMLREIVDLMRSGAADKQLVLKVEASTPLPRHVTSDPTRLRQILTNLIGNAIKFTEHGTVRIAVSCTPPGELPGRLRILVEDTGIGMTPRQQMSLFQPFSQGDNTVTRRYGGTGLGLAISQRLAAMLGGAIHAASEPGVGTTFCLTIDPGPLSADDYRPSSMADCDAAATLPPATPSSANSRTLRVLVAEDGPDNQRLFRAMLAKAGHDFTIVGDGEAACTAVLAAAHAQRPFDVVVMDMQMPVLDGYGATRRLRALGITTPVIACTAHAMAEDRDRCLAAGCSDFTTKPIDRRALLAKIAARSPALAAASDPT